jgi:hypothetical protein
LVDTVDEVLAAALDEPVVNSENVGEIGPNGTGITKTDVVIKH